MWLSPGRPGQIVTQWWYNVHAVTGSNRTLLSRHGPLSADTPLWWVIRASLLKRSMRFYFINISWLGSSALRANILPGNRALFVKQLIPFPAISFKESSAFWQCTMQLLLACPCYKAKSVRNGRGFSRRQAKTGYRAMPENSRCLR